MSRERQKEQWEEFVAWKRVVELLKKTGAVTEDDCKSVVTEQNTDGQKLFAAIRTWGGKLVKLGEVHDRGMIRYNPSKEQLELEVVKVGKNKYKVVGFKKKRRKLSE